MAPGAPAAAGARQLGEALRAAGWEDLGTAAEEGARVGVFSYGSNNVEQLRARLQVRRSKLRGRLRSRTD